MARIACIMVADFSIAALVRSNPALADKVLAIGKSLAPHAELDAVSPRARELGIRPGMTIAQARAISSDLIVVHRSPAAESSAHSALLDAVESVSPVIESGAPGCAWVDLAGLHRIYNGEEEITAELMRCVRRVGMEPAAGVAANKELAHLAARCGGVRVIEAGREREFLNWLPLDMLGLGKSDRGDDLETTLARWGMRRLGELARLNPDAVGTRLGRRGVELVRLARGGSHAPLVPRRRAEFFVETVELEYGIELLEPLGFVMRAMLERLAERLSLRGMVAGDITLAFGMSGHRSFNRQVEVAAPSNDVRAILTLINLSLEAAPPEAAVESIRIEIAPRVPRPAQTDMFLPPCSRARQAADHDCAAGGAMRPRQRGHAERREFASARSDASRCVRTAARATDPRKRSRKECDAARDTRDSSGAGNRSDVLAGDSGVRSRRESWRARNLDRRPMASRR